MQRLDEIRIAAPQGTRTIALYAGDLAHLPADEAVDVLIVSAFPSNYVPTRTSLIGALYRAGISVEALAEDKEVDLRRLSSCWLSRPVSTPGANFRRILCFEPPVRGQAAELVGDVFRSIFPFAAGEPYVRQIALPLLAAGNQRQSPTAMLEAIVSASAHWLAAGLPLERIKLVVRAEDSNLAALQQTFAAAKARHDQAPLASAETVFRYDAFISYSHKNKQAADWLVEVLRAELPQLRVFMDRLELRPGAAWQQEIFESLDASRKIVCLLSPDYLASKVCLEEFHMGVLRHRESTAGVMLPVFLHTTPLPTYMRMYQYHDAREGAQEQVSAAAQALVQSLRAEASG